MFKFFNSKTKFGSKKKEGFSDSKNESLVCDIRFSIHVISKYIPWENACRHQAFQAKILCRLYRIPYKIFVGFKKSETGKIEGHAWTMIDDQMITGFCEPSIYTVQSVYS